MCSYTRSLWLFSFSVAYSLCGAKKHFVLVMGNQSSNGWDEAELAILFKFVRMAPFTNLRCLNPAVMSVPISKQSFVKGLLHTTD